MATVRLSETKPTPLSLAELSAMVSRLKASAEFSGAEYVKSLQVVEEPGAVTLILEAE